MAPPHTRTEGCVRRGCGPALVQRAQQLVHGLPVHVAMDQHFRQPRGQLRRLGDVERVPREGQGLRPRLRQRHPGAAPAQLVAGSLDDDATGGERDLHPRPGRRDGVLGVLAQHVEGPHHPGAQSRQLEATPPKTHRRSAGGLRSGHPRRVDLQPDHLQIGLDPAQSRGQLDRGHRGGAVAEVDHQRRAAQCASHSRAVQEPAITAAQAVDAGGASGDGAVRAR